MEFKWSDGGEDDFPDLQIKVRDEIVTFGVPDEIIVDENGVVGGGVHLKPEEVNALVAKRDDVVFFDGRNAFEANTAKGLHEQCYLPQIRLFFSLDTFL